MIMPPSIEVFCDLCGKTQKFPLIAVNGRWTTDHLPVLLRRNGWKQPLSEGNEIFCASCDASLEALQLSRKSELFGEPPVLKGIRLLPG